LLDEPGAAETPALSQEILERNSVRGSHGPNFAEKSAEAANPRKKIRSSWKYTTGKEKKKQKKNALKRGGEKVITNL